MYPWSVMLVHVLSMTTLYVLRADAWNPGSIPVENAVGLLLLTGYYCYSG
jgi:hypothetical protein